MPYRRVVFAPGEIYHVFNRSVAHNPIFTHTRDCQRAIELVEYYLYRTNLPFSHFDRLPKPKKLDFLNSLRHQPKLVSLFTFCLMPNHFHFLLQENMRNGLSTFIKNFQNSYAKFFNTKYERNGSLFQSMFKAVRIENNDQLLHVQRYIHLNPLTSFVLKDENELSTHPWSSYLDYLTQKKGSFVDTGLILNQFSSTDKFREFTINQIDYQRQLNQIKHLLLE